MTHFFVLVILPKDTTNPSRTIEILMDPYNEEVEGGRQPKFWDWYVIGGRYNGVVTGTRIDSKDGFNFGDEYHKIENNTVKMRELKLVEGFDPPQHIMLPNGDYIEREELGWWAITLKEHHTQEQWKAKWEGLKAQYLDHYVVGLDVHI